MKITTKQIHNGNGTPQVIAKGGGKQRTVGWHLAKSADWNHGNAAGTLGLVLFQGDKSREIAAKTATHRVNNDQSHTFTIGV